MHGREPGFDDAQTSCLCDCGLSSCCSSQGRCCVRPRHGPCLTLDYPRPSIPDDSFGFARTAMNA